MRWKTLAALLISTSVAWHAADSAALAHSGRGLFVWSYPRLGFHGEADLILALEKMGLEFAAPHPLHPYARRAEVLLKRAHPVLCSPIARNETLVAIGHLKNYRLTDRALYLTVAARAVRRALEAERRCHPHVVPSPAVVAHPAPPVAPAPVVVVPQPVVVPAGVLHFGGKHWAVSIRF